ncbi:tRNA-dihydrouridine synthase family protein [Deinococcus sonorensis]|uniref:tRNA-dihydrouridine synthase n=2 Tax=Deinococcus sonorensis TaxID=309891 RepID=A0AAU7UD17_9DEIO
MNAGFYQDRLRVKGAVLAPMAGYSDAPMRQLCSEQGALWTVSEMISARGLVHGGENASLDLGRPYPGEQNRVVQLFGDDPEVLAGASIRAAEWFGAAALDLNMGCPVPKLRGRGGACLLQTPDVAYRLVTAMRGAVPLDVSAKIRLGWDHNRAVELAQGLAAAGASLITVHGRTSAQKYTGEADWDAIQAVAASVDVPVVGSGDIQDLPTLQRRQQGGVAAVMVGRGAVGNPWLFAQARGDPDRVPDHAERVQTALRHARLNVQWYGERRGLLQLRKVLPRYFPARPEWRERLVQISTLPELEHLLMGPPVRGAVSAPRTGYDLVRS